MGIHALREFSFYIKKRSASFSLCCAWDQIRAPVICNGYQCGVQGKPEAGLHAGDVITSAGIYTDDITDNDEVGALYDHTGFGDDLFGDAGGGIAADGHLSFDDFQVDRGGQFHINGFTFVEGELDFHAFGKEFGAIAKGFLLDSGLFEGGIIHKVVEIAIVV